jgi:hypothetical protein
MWCGLRLTGLLSAACQPVAFLAGPFPQVKTVTLHSLERRDLVNNDGCGEYGHVAS